MSKMIGAPTRYRQGKDELKCLGDDLKDNKRIVVITSEKLERDVYTSDRGKLT